MLVLLSAGGEPGLQDHGSLQLIVPGQPVSCDLPLLIRDLVHVPQVLRGLLPVVVGEVDDEKSDGESHRVSASPLARKHSLQPLD